MEDNSKIIFKLDNEINNKNIQNKINAKLNCQNIYSQKLCQLIEMKNKSSSEIVEKNKKYRNPGVDLVRLIGMFCIILTHILTFGQAYKKYNIYYKQLLSLRVLTNWHNNGFALISGFVGYKSNKYSNLLYLWFSVFCYSFGIHLFIILFKRNYIVNDNISIECFPIINQRFWYFTAYFGMFLFLPIINKGLQNLSIQFNRFNKNKINLN